ncbi:hypothetical protein P691DRAFT_757667 [Macrolepiota fuliginosa MF-IS2]|uniref:Uncharacterized protein n=1 Tax=Macrolepiota fuliginosa MF-IS2 TaxID=1400762 RepID=A0A9P5XJN1_9AGAR|nr:hypothetical protein P691DRAFT_757667 [Macrolepiota fuliginosa MF-IS2]
MLSLSTILRPWQWGSDKCTWCSTSDFRQLRAHMRDSAPLRMDELRAAYNDIASALADEDIPFAVVGGYAIIAYGADRGRMTQDIDFFVNGRPRDLIKVLRRHPGVMIMEESCRANYFRVYYLLPSSNGSLRYVGIDFTLIPSSALDLREYQGYTDDRTRVLTLNALVEAKLEAFYVSGAAKDRNDIFNLVSKYGTHIKSKRQNQERVNFFLEHCGFMYEARQILEFVLRQ